MSRPQVVDEQFLTQLADLKDGMLARKTWMFEQNEDVLGVICLGRLSTDDIERMRVQYVSIDNYAIFCYFKSIESLT